MKISLSLVLLVLVSGSSAFARTLAEIQKDGTLSVATEGAFPPFNFVKDGEIQGFEIDLVNEMAKKVGLKTRWQAVHFDSLLLGLFQNDYDLVAASHAETEARAKAVDFLPAHYCSGGEILSLKNGPKTVKDLTGKAVGVQFGSIYPKFLETNTKAKSVHSFRTDPDVVQAVISGRVDAALTDRFLVKQSIKDHSELQAGDIVNQERDAMAVKKGNTELLAKLKGALETIMKDGTYEKISKKYFGEDIRCKGEPKAARVKKASSHHKSV